MGTRLVSPFISFVLGIGEVVGMSTLKRAIAIARKAHKGQVDKGGAPYILHPLRMMARLFTEEERIVAVLHDVVEDGGVSLSALRAEGFSETVIAAVDSLTKRPGETYETFVLRAASNDIGRSVKLADLSDNCENLSRIPKMTPADYERLGKYQIAVATILCEYPDPANEVVRAEQRELPAGSSIEAEAKFECCLCGKEAGHILLLRTTEGVELLRYSFTSIMGPVGGLEQKKIAKLRAVIDRHNARPLFALDLELTPFYCLECDRCYCGDHWIWWSEFDEDAPMFRDCIRGRCPSGHERMLED